MRQPRTLVCAMVLLPMLACGTNTPGAPPEDGLLAIGTWGGAEAGVIVTDTIAHVHIGCTYGDLPGRVTLDADGRFSLAGSFLLRAYPVAIGPTMPAQFTGRVAGETLTITVTVRDTIAKTDVVRGPVSVRLGTVPTMANCPICSTPGDRSSPRVLPGADTKRARWYDRLIGGR